MDSNTTKLLRTHLNSHKINNCVYTNFSAILSFCHNFLANCDTLTGQAIKGQFTGLQVYLVYLKAPIVFQMINAYFYGASLASSTGLEMCGGDHLVGSIWKVLDFHISIRYACKCKRANGQKMGNVPINFFDCAK